MIPGARVGADASVEMASKLGSIHQLGAAAQGAPGCNGWTFWHVEIGVGAGAARYAAAGR